MADFGGFKPRLKFFKFHLWTTKDKIIWSEPSRIRLFDLNYQDCIIWSELSRLYYLIWTIKIGLFDLNYQDCIIFLNYQDCIIWSELSRLDHLIWTIKIGLFDLNCNGSIRLLRTQNIFCFLNHSINGRPETKVRFYKLNIRQCIFLKLS